MNAGLETLTNQHLPESFLAGCIRVVFAARKLAHEACLRDFAPPEAENVFPFYMRGKIQESLRGLSDRTPGCTSEIVRTDGSFWNHTEITSGPILLTAHPVQTPCGKVRDFKYQLSLATRNEPSLLDDNEEIPAEKLYILLLHSPFQGFGDSKGIYGYLPGSVYLAYPTSTLQDYVYEIDLFQRFPALVDSLLPKEWDQQAKVAYRWQASQRVAS